MKRLRKIGHELVECECPTPLQPVQGNGLKSDKSYYVNLKTDESLLPGTSVNIDSVLPSGKSANVTVSLPSGKSSASALEVPQTVEPGEQKDQWPLLLN